jgi:hypothetical protein
MNFNRDFAEILLFAYFCGANARESVQDNSAVAKLIAGILESINKKGVNHV